MFGEAGAAQVLAEPGGLLGGGGLAALRALRQGLGIRAECERKGGLHTES